jgi:hypothetical protein
MKTTVIILISLLFMIPFSYAGEDGENNLNPKGTPETSVVIENVVPSAELIVINLNDEIITDNGLPQDILDQFCKLICYPKDVENAAKEECVMVGFSYDDEGYINVENTSSSSDTFNDHVVTNIEKIRLRDGNVTVGKQYFAKFSFKRL